MAVTGILANKAKQTGKTKAQVFDEIVTEGKTQFGMAVLLGCQPGNVVYWLREFGYKWDAETHTWLKESPETEQEPQSAA
jgi:hypothetical protein